MPQLALSERLSRLLILLVFFVIRTAAQTLPADEYAALYDLYQATDGTNWNINGNRWNFTSGANPCSEHWQGVGCVFPPPFSFYHVHNLTLDNCQLNGIIPSSLGNLTYMNRLDLSNNAIIGTLPAEILWLPNLIYLDISNAQLHGTLPSPPNHNSISSISNMHTLLLSSNLFSGTLPREMSQMINLTNLHLQYNTMSGSAAMLPTSLTHIDLRFNHFTNALDELPFLSSGNMTEALLSYNCFHGTLPTTLCNNNKLSGLELEYMNSHASCSHRLFPRSAYVSDPPLQGTVPWCLFQLPSLTVLLLNNNQLTGSLPADIYLPNDKMYLQVDYNQFTGHFPVYLGSVYADHNRMNGGLMYNFTVFDFSAGNNRLSGPLPSVITDAKDASSEAEFIMSGNLFNCKWDNSNVPKGAVEYQCATNDFDKAYIAYLVVVCSILLLAGVTYYWRDKIEKYVDVDYVVYTGQKWLHASVHGSGGKSTHVSLVWGVSTSACKCAIIVAVTCVFVLAPVYAILTAYYGTYTYQSALSVGSVLLSGPSAFATQLLLFLIVLCVFVYVMVYSDKQLSIPKEQIPLNGRATRGRVFVICSLFVLANFVAVGTVHVLFISSTLYASSLRYQLAISAFKTGWSALCMPYLSRWVVYELSASRNDFFTLELMVSLMNNIALPYIAVMAVSSECFFDLYRGELLTWSKVSTAYNEPYYYSYQCAYTYFNYYYVAYIDVCLFTSLGTPLIEFVTLQLHHRAVYNSRWYKLLDTFLPRILRPIETDPERMPARNVFKPYFDSTQFLVNQFTNLALILTLGVVFPPLALCFAVTMVATTSYAMLKVGRLLSHAAEEKQPQYAELIQEESTGVVTASLLSRARGMLLVCSCWFMALFLFDTLGDAQGVQSAYWVLIFVPLLPLLFLAVLSAYDVFSIGDDVHSKSAPDSGEDAELGIELQNTVEVVSPLSKLECDNPVV